MHPVLRQFKPSAGGAAEGDAPAWGREPEGLVRLTDARPEAHPRVAMKKEVSEAFVPPQNVLRDEAGSQPEAARHQRFEAGRLLSANHDKRRVLTDEDFEVDGDLGMSPARAHLSASNLVTAYEQTVKAEQSFQTTFNNNLRTLIAREETTVGLMHLWDFVSAFIEHPHSKALIAQMFLIAQHCKDQGVLRDSLLSITDPSSRWLVDLINILQTIIVQERELSVAEKVAAVNYSIMSLSKFYARRIYQTPYVPIDREVKVNTFYMRCVLSILCLSDDLGVYRNSKLERVVSVGRRREASDAEFLEDLQRVLHNDQEEDEWPESEVRRGENVGAGMQGAGALDRWDGREAPEFSMSFQHGR